MRLYSINEVFGPVDCEIPVIGKDKCGKEAWTFILSKYEDSILLRKEGYEATQQIFEQSLGTAMCGHHLDLLFDRKKTKKPEDVKVSSFKIDSNQMIKIEDIKERRFNVDRAIEDAKIVKTKSDETLLFMRCYCGREVKITEDGITTYLPDFKEIHKGKSQAAKNYELDVMLVKASFAIRCTCGKDMTGTFVRRIEPERKYYIGSSPRRFEAIQGIQGITGI